MFLSQASFKKISGRVDNIEETRVIRSASPAKAIAALRPHRRLVLFAPASQGPFRRRQVRLLVISKIDSAPHASASLEVMDREARKMRGERQFVFSNLKTGKVWRNHHVHPETADWPEHEHSFPGVARAWESLFIG